ncbi:MAG: hypothetical protein Q9166_006272 [cf. Caloplaca sp. 2 TL-2023]
MTTPSTTVLVDGTPEEIPTSQATSVDREEESSDINATRRHHLEQLVVPTLQVEQQRMASAASFNSSIDRLNDNADDLHLPRSSRQQEQEADGINTASTNHANNVLVHNASSEPFSLRDDPSTNQQIANSDHPQGLDGTPSTTALEPSSVRLNPTIPSPSQAPTSPPASRQSSQLPSTNNRTTSTDQRTHHHRRRRRLLRWLRRHLDHPHPWNLSLRRRAENIRRQILDVDRLLP